MRETLNKLQRPLTRDEIDFRVGSVVKSGEKAFATILAYKDARTDMKVLDEATDGLWQNEYRRDSKGVLQCGIAIKVGDEWVWKWSNGTATDIESEKGEYSDAFKRAGFMWGIGRELYDVPTLFVTLKTGEFNVEGGKARATNKLKPNDWEWEFSQDLKKFKAKDKDGQRLYVDETEVTEQKASPTQPAKLFTPPPPTNKGLGNCAKCGAPNTWSQTKGKAYCSKRCWNNPPKQDLPTINVDDQDKWIPPEV